ncbi:MAG: alanine racemase [Bacteroidia bacterium]|nr:alanine racemase [Bacteroidia bacterium]
MKLGRVWTGKELAAIVEGIPYANAEDIIIQHLYWDTRRLSGEEHSLFIALKAQRDGHDFVSEAFQRKVSIALVSTPPKVPIPYILVQDTWAALYQWAKAWRTTLSYPILAITGSVGKTWIKEWLAYLLEDSKSVHRSPGSFNSRLGVPVSLLSFPAEGDLGIIEAGISAPGDMLPLSQLIHPTYGILSPMGSAHDEMFPNFEAKLREKLQLFTEVEWLLALKQAETFSVLRELRTRLYIAGFSRENHFWWEKTAPKNGIWHIGDDSRVPFKLPEDSLAAWQNALLSASAAVLLGIEPVKIQERLATLPTLQNRLQWIQDGSGRLWLNDTYHADASSVAVAIEELRSIPLQPKIAILTDFSPYTADSHKAALSSLQSFLPDESIHLIGETFMSISSGGNRYPNTETFFREAHLPTKGVFLIKGSRRFRLEEALERLMGYGPAPELHIDWEKVYRNLAYLRTQLPPGTKIMSVLKAEAYGSGDLLMASFLERQGISYIGVAYTREAIRLREAGIQSPILVFYPGEAPHRLYLDYNLEAAVGTEQALTYWTGEVPVHLEFDTGMGRMGIPVQALPEVLSFLKTHKVAVRGVFTHLAESSQPYHPLTQLQLRQFKHIYEKIKSAFPETLGHILNTGGVLSMGREAAYDMVRVGIGLYGVGDGLEEATALYAPILRVASVQVGQKLNYGFISQVPQNTEVATVAIGYGDGLPRRWAEKGAYVYLHGQACHVLPPLNMDLMLIAAPVGTAQSGDKVEIWGNRRTLKQLASEAETIPYEILVRLSPRIYRLYSWGG